MFPLFPTCSHCYKKRLRVYFGVPHGVPCEEYQNTFPFVFIILDFFDRFHHLLLEEVVSMLVWNLGWKECEMNMDFYTFYNFFWIVTSILMRHSIHVFGMSTLHACTLLVICGSLRFMTLCKFKQHVTNITKLCTIAYPRLDMNFKLATTIRMRSNIVPSIIHINLDVIYYIKYTN